MLSKIKYCKWFKIYFFWQEVSFCDFIFSNTRRLWFLHLSISYLLTKILFSPVFIFALGTKLQKSSPCKKKSKNTHMHGYSTVYFIQRLKTIKKSRIIFWKKYLIWENIRKSCFVNCHIKNSLFKEVLIKPNVFNSNDRKKTMF